MVTNSALVEDYYNRHSPLFIYIYIFQKIEAHGGARRRTFKDIEAAKYDSSDGEQE